MEGKRGKGEVGRGAKGLRKLSTVSIVRDESNPIQKVSTPIYIFFFIPKPGGRKGVSKRERGGR